MVLKYFCVFVCYSDTFKKQTKFISNTKFLNTVICKIVKKKQPYKIIINFTELCLTLTSVVTYPKKAGKNRVGCFGKIHFSNVCPIQLLFAVGRTILLINFVPYLTKFY